MLAPEQMSSRPGFTTPRATPLSTDPVAWVPWPRRYRDAGRASRSVL